MHQKTESQKINCVDLTLQTSECCTMADQGDALKVNKRPKDDTSDDEDAKNPPSVPVNDQEEEEVKSPESMKALFASATGPPEKVVAIKDVPIPKITKPDQVLVKVQYAAINPIDRKIIIGRMGPA